MTVARRVAVLESSLDPLQVVLRVVAEAHEHAGLEAYARAIAEVSLEAAPMSRVASETDASVRAATKGRRREEVDKAVRRAVGDAVFRYILFLRLNAVAIEIADHEGLRAAAAFYWMGCLLGGPRREELGPAEWAEHQAEQDAAWERWRWVVANLFVVVMVEEEARDELQKRYLGGRKALLPDAEEAWDRFAEQVGRLWTISETLRGECESPDAELDDEPDPLADRVHDRIRAIADDARISTFERLGDMPRAVAIVEARIRSG